MPKYVYPAVFTPENNYYLVTFPDFKNCFTDGDSLIDAVEMGSDALALTICYCEENNISLPTPTPLKDIRVSDNSFSSLIICDTTNYPYKKMDKKSDKNFKKEFALSNE